MIAGDADPRDAPAAPADDRPYLGLRTYEEPDAGRFFGREEPVEELVRMVRRRSLTVLLGVSGIGKSSLIQAGLFPALRADSYLPIWIRLDFSGAERDLGVQVRQAIARELELRQVEAPPPGHGVSLWRYFVNTPLWSRRNRLLVPLLAFDQFEEMFTIGRGFASQALDLIQDLSELIERRPTLIDLAGPEGDGAGGEDRAASRRDFVPPDPRVLVSLREDFLAHLEDFRGQLPSLVTNRYRLTRMTGGQALRAVKQPAGTVVTATTARQIVEFVAAKAGAQAAQATAELGALEIEPTLLSLVCDELDLRRRELRLPEITGELITQQGGQIVERFYDRAFTGLPVAMRTLVEDKLVTSDGYRTTMAYAAALDVKGVTKEGIDALIDRRVLRSETRFGTPHIELIHDQLTRVARQRRQEAEHARRTRRFLVGTFGAIGVALTLIAGVIYWQLSVAADRNRERNLRANAKELAEVLIDVARDALLRGESPHAADLLWRAQQKFGDAQMSHAENRATLQEHELLMKRALVADDERPIAVDHGSELACVRLSSGDLLGRTSSTPGDHLITCSRDGTVRPWQGLPSQITMMPAHVQPPSGAAVQLIVPGRTGWIVVVRDDGSVALRAPDRTWSAHDAPEPLAPHPTGPPRPWQIRARPRVGLAQAAGDLNASPDSISGVPNAPDAPGSLDPRDAVSWRACVAPDDSGFAVWAPGTPWLRVWQLAPSRPDAVRSEPRRPAARLISHVTCLDGGRLLIATPDAIELVVDGASRDVLRAPRTGGRYTRVVGSRDGRVIAAVIAPAAGLAVAQPVVQLLVPPDPPTLLGLPQGALGNLAVSGDGRRVLATVRETTSPADHRTFVGVWSTADGALAFAVQRPSAVARWLPDEKGVVIASAGHRLEAWDVESRQIFATGWLEDELAADAFGADGGLIDLAGQRPRYTVASGRGNVAHVGLLAPEPAWADLTVSRTDHDLGLWVSPAMDAGPGKPAAALPPRFERRPDGTLVVPGAAVDSSVAALEIAPARAAAPTRIAVLRHDGSVTLLDEQARIVRALETRAHAIRWSAERELLTLESTAVRIWSERGDPTGRVEIRADDAQLTVRPQHALWTCDRERCTGWDLATRQPRAWLSIGRLPGPVRLSSDARTILDRRGVRYVLPPVPAAGKSRLRPSPVEALAFLDGEHVVSTTALGDVHATDPGGTLAIPGPSVAAAISPPGLALAAGRMLTVGTLADYQTHKQRSIWGRGSPIAEIAWAGPDRLAVVNAALELGIVPASRATPDDTLAGLVTDVRPAGDHAVFSPSGERFAMVAPSGDIVVYAVRTAASTDAPIASYATMGANIRQLLLPEPIRPAAPSPPRSGPVRAPDPVQIVAAWTDDGVTLWHQPGAPSQVWYGSYRTVVISPDGQHLVALRSGAEIADVLQIDPAVGTFREAPPIAATAIAIDDRSEHLMVLQPRAGGVELGVYTWGDDGKDRIRTSRPVLTTGERMVLRPGVGKDIWLPDAHRLVHVVDDPGKSTSIEHAGECVFSGESSRALCVFTGEGEPYLQQIGIPSGNKLGTPYPLKAVPERLIAATGHSDLRIAVGVVSEGMTRVLVFHDAAQKPHELALPGTPALRLSDGDRAGLWALADDGRLLRWQIGDATSTSERGGVRLLDMMATSTDVRLAISDPERGLVIAQSTQPPTLPLTGLASSTGVRMARFRSPEVVVGVVHSGGQDLVAVWRNGEYAVLKSSSTSPVTALATLRAPDRLAAVGREDGTIEIWTSESGSVPLVARDAPGRRPSPIRHIAVGHGWIATSSDDGSVSVWRLDGTELTRLSAGRAPAGRTPQAPVIAFSPDEPPALAIGMRSGDLKVVTLGLPMPEDATARIRRAARADPAAR
ncbi:MAG TPA: hypothetical protein VFK02_14810 [Kofleriaceae bacterium]|nr:hypothetical protein [Kofleriaceae bacterium]